MGNERNRVVLVDSSDNEIGHMDKLLAHQHGGSRHRAFSIFILNRSNELLLQKRSGGKYTAPHTWSNTCCSHPQPGETTLSSANKRLQEELGFETSLTTIGSVEYRVSVGESLTEWELDHLFVGYYDGPVRPNPTEVSEVKWMTLPQLRVALKNNPHDFSPWFVLIFPALEKYCKGA